MLFVPFSYPMLKSNAEAKAASLKVLHEKQWETTFLKRI